MAKPIIGGPDTPKPQAPRSECGGVEMKDVKTIRYSEPMGPKGIMHKGVGLGGDNHGNGTNGTHEGMSGSPGIGGSRMKAGTQR